MKIIAIETTDSVGGVAAMENGQLLLEVELNSKQRSAQSLPPGMIELLEGVGWKPNDVELVACTIGPGSFTGLRVGVTMAKTFAYSIGAEILGVNTLDTIAEAAPNDVSNLTAVIDAQRGDIVTRSYRRGPDGWPIPIGEQQLMSIEKWLDELPAGMAAIGPILGKIASRLPGHITAIEEQYWRPKAAMVARLAHRHYAAGQRDNIWTLLPEYSRRSAAEEKLLNKK